MQGEEGGGGWCRAKGRRAERMGKRKEWRNDGAQVGRSVFIESVRDLK